VKSSLGVNELRKMFLEFFEEKEHLKLNSFSLIPQNDNSLLLINSGMAPLKPYFTGQEVPPKKRVTTCQKCIRTGDIENVGKTSRHGTFFEMLGNFSFGDYFKHEAIAWSWEFLTKVVGLDENRLYPSVYKDDDEAFEIWNKEIGIDKNRIFKFGKEDNFWEHGAGPCGPCSEIYYDRGEKYGCGSPNCTVGCECDRYMEVWNNVFTQFSNDGKGNYEELEQKNIDTGMGLERLAVAVQDVESIFDVDTIKALRDEVCKVAKVKYNKDANKDVSIRVITDHIRSVTFMISDGIIPSNEGRGYVLRKLLRRAARHGKLLGINKKFLADLSKKVIQESKDGYKELEDNKDFILKTITIEENNFNKLIDKGLSRLAQLEKELSKKKQTVLDGSEAFKLYDTFGFPLDLTKEILEEKGLSVDEDGFTKEMERQRELGRTARKETNYMGAEQTVYNEIDANITSEFDGYENISLKSKCIVLTTDTEIVNEIKEGQIATIITEKTPFYATMGGQCADIGVITSEKAKFLVKDTIKLQGDKIGHVGLLEKGTIKVGDKLELTIDVDNRKSTSKNHSATHLLQKALQTVLGDHVKQAGSLVDKDKLRFDFTHNEALSKEELKQVEDMVNKKISEAIEVKTQVMSLNEAKKTGAMALFGEKYGQTVRVVKMGDFSTELCGGTHVANTSDIAVFKIVSESGIASGVRRIEAITSKGVFDYYKNMESILLNAAVKAKAEPSMLVKKIESMQEEIKELSKENEKMKSELAKGALGDVLNQAKDVNGIKALVTKLEGVDMNELRNLGDSLKEKVDGVIVLVSKVAQDKVNLVAMASDSAMKKGAHAGMLIKEVAKVVGGGGGGRPNMAQAGGKNPSKIDEALSKAIETLKGQIK